jgi:hypothetical protein
MAWGQIQVMSLPMPTSLKRQRQAPIIGRQALNPFQWILKVIACSLFLVSRRAKAAAPAFRNMK